LNSSIDDITRRLREIGYQVERIQNQALLLPPDRLEPNFSALEDRLEHEWRLLCARAGFETPAQQPPMPGNARRLLLRSGNVYQDMVMAHTRDTLLTPMNQYLAVSPLPSPELAPLQPRVVEEPEAPNVDHMLDSITLGEPGRSTASQDNPVEGIYNAEMYAILLNSTLPLTSLGS
jgi:hypothetical protein